MKRLITHMISLLLIFCFVSQGTVIPSAFAASPNPDTSSSTTSGASEAGAITADKTPELFQQVGQSLDNSAGSNKSKTTEPLPAAPPEYVAQKPENSSETSDSSSSSFLDVAQNTLDDTGMNLITEASNSTTEYYRKTAELYSDKAESYYSRRAYRWYHENNVMQQEYDTLRKESEVFSNALDSIGFVKSILEIIQDGINMGFNLHNATAETQLWEWSGYLASMSATAFFMLSTAEFTVPALLISAGVMFLANLYKSFVTSPDFDVWYANAKAQILSKWDDFMTWIRQAFSVRVLKPNIYLYTNEPTDVLVTFDQDQLLTTSIPDYGTGWHITTSASSHLTTPSGESYGFLFYESVSARSLMQTTEGYFIPFEKRVAKFTEILDEMGFNQQEIADFTAFWSEKLEENTNYIMYPQYTETVDLAMPITVSPTPDQMERIWFVFEADKGQPYTTPEPYHFNRNGDFSVVEWGGMIFS